MKTLTLTRGKNSEGTILYITDATTTYGTDLPARNTLALVIYATYKHSDGTIDIVTPQAHSPLNVVTFNLPVENKDGIYYVYVFALPAYTSQPLSDGDIVYDTADGIVKIYEADDDSLTAYDIAELVGNEDIDYGRIDSKIDFQLTKYQDQLELITLEKLEESLDNRCEEFEYQVALKNSNYVRLLRSAANVYFCQGTPIKAQQLIETGIDFAEKALGIDE